MFKCFVPLQPFQEVKIDDDSEDQKERERSKRQDASLGRYIQLLKMHVYARIGIAREVIEALESTKDYPDEVKQQQCITAKKTFMDDAQDALKHLKCAEKTTTWELPSWECKSSQELAAMHNNALIDEMHQLAAALFPATVNE